MKTPTNAAAQLAITTLIKQAPEATNLAIAFKAAGFKLALVGGPVRDAILGRLGNDLDFTTNAHPKECEKILNKWADSVWDVGAAFGTIAGKKDEITVEITTYRSESYSADSRKPNVEFGENIEGDLSRRDFTINAMALELTTDEPTFIDLYNGVDDLQGKLIKTPGKPEDSFSDDPLRMMRAARFMSQLNFTIDPAVIAAIKSMTARLEIISAERIRDEFIKIIMSDNPRLGITLLVETGLADIFLPEIPKLKLEIDEHHHHKDVYEHTLTVLEQAIALEERLGGPNLTLRLAALLHDIGKVPDAESDLPHALLGMQWAEKYGEKEEVCNAIGAHHDEIEMKSLLSPIIQVCDAISGARPGARRQVLDSYIQRLKDLEEVAFGFNGVKNAYAIQAGRELRVIVESEKVSDDNAATLSFEISQKIQTEMTYPGQVKVTVIRETRAVNIAK